MKYVRILVIFCIIFSLFSCFVFADDTPIQIDGNGDFAKETVTVESIRISASSTSGFHAIILGLLGDYNPIVKDYTYTSTQGYTSHSIDIQPDWSWIASAFIFVVVVYCIFRLIGSVLGGIK